MGPPSYMRSVVDRKVLLRRMTVLKDEAPKQRKYFLGKIVYESGSVLMTCYTELTTLLSN